MTQKNNNFPIWKKINAWREILARVFENVETKFNVSPEWLVNPATNRRLKLDMLYPKFGVAVRFEGLQSKQRRRRLSLEEEAQQHTRNNARVKVCQAHKINLIVVDAAMDNPKTVFQKIDLMLSLAGQQVEDVTLSQKIRQARATASALSYRINRSGNLKLYAELWEDRQYQIPEPSQTPDPAKSVVSFTAGMAVEHNTFGPGLILAVNPGDNDTLLTVDFISAGQKILAASLVGDKLRPR